MKPLLRLLWIILLGVILGLVCQQVVLPLLWRASEKKNGPKLLAAASETQLHEAVGPLGCVLRYPDGSWLAIRYVDCHMLAFWSLAIARDSGGAWYESTEHFCGSLGSIRAYQSGAEFRGAPKDPPQSHMDWIRLLALSPDLQTARQRITSRYFHQIQ